MNLITRKELYNLDWKVLQNHALTFKAINQLKTSDEDEKAYAFYLGMRVEGYRYIFFYEGDFAKAESEEEKERNLLLVSLGKWFEETVLKKDPSLDLKSIILGKSSNIELERFDIQYNWVNSNKTLTKLLINDWNELYFRALTIMGIWKILKVKEVNGEDVHDIKKTLEAFYFYIGMRMVTYRGVYPYEPAFVDIDSIATNAQLEVIVAMLVMGQEFEKIYLHKEYGTPLEDFLFTDHKKFLQMAYSHPKIGKTMRRRQTFTNRLSIEEIRNLLY